IVIRCDGPAAPIVSGGMTVLLSPSAAKLVVTVGPSGAGPGPRVGAAASGVWAPSSLAPGPGMNGMARTRAAGGGGRPAAAGIWSHVPAPTGPTVSESCAAAASDQVRQKNTRSSVQALRTEGGAAVTTDAMTPPSASTAKRMSTLRAAMG